MRVDGSLKPGVTAKDIILALIARIGIGGGTGCVFEYRGSAIRALSMEERMTICNMSIEGGARAGLIAPDDTTYQYVAGRPFAPKGADWDAAVARWRTLPTDEGATYDREDDDRRECAGADDHVRHESRHGHSDLGSRSRSRDYLRSQRKRDRSQSATLHGSRPRQAALGHTINVVFVGSCTNSRISDLRAAAALLKGRKVSPNVRMMVVPGSQQVKEQAEAEGLDKIFRDAGADFREAGCSMCIAMNGDQLQPGEYSVSTSNRNFEGRQGKGGRTFLASPLTAAAAALTGVVTDVRTLL